MASLDVTRSYSDGNTLTGAMLDAIVDDLETFLNTTKINDDNIQNAGITASSKLIDASITAAKLATDSVTTAKIEALAVTAAKLAADSVTTAKILDANVTTAKLAAATAAFLMPTGVILPYTASSAPTGYLTCDGSQVNRVTYADLYAIIGTKYGNGDGSTTFHLPDLRGRFLRGYDNGAGNDPNAGTRSVSNTGGNSGDNIGSYQADAMQGHYHDFYYDYGSNSPSAGTYQFVSPTGSNTTNGANDSVRGALTDGTNGTPRTASESRPKNVTVQYIIKT
jgi:microcystin-dependent protein